MRNLGVVTMILGVLSTMSSTYFTIIHKQYGIPPIIFFWLLLSGFEFFCAWFWLVSKPRVISYSQKLTLAALAAITFVWALLVLTSGDPKSILLWALKTLNYSGVYFVGLVITYQARKSSSHHQRQ